MYVYISRIYKYLSADISDITQMGLCASACVGFTNFVCISNCNCVESKPILAAATHMTANGTVCLNLAEVLMHTCFYVVLFFVEICKKVVKTAVVKS